MKGVYAVGDCAMPVKRVTIVVASGTARAGGLAEVLPVDAEGDSGSFSLGKSWWRGSIQEL